MMGTVGLTLINGDPCANAPTLSTATQLAVTMNDCSAMTDPGYTLDIDLRLASGSLGSYEFEVWMKEWKDAESEPASFTYDSRFTSTGLNEVERDLAFGLGSTGAAETRRRKAAVYLVPGNSTNGSGQTFSCDSHTTAQVNSTGASCFA